MGTRINHNGQVKGDRSIPDDGSLKLRFVPNQREGTITCYRTTADGEERRPIIYNIDSSHPALNLLEAEERAEFIAARDLLGWKDQSPKMTNFK